MPRCQCIPAFWLAYLCLASCAISATPGNGKPGSSWVQGTASFFGGPADTKSNTYQKTIDSGSCGYGDLDPRLYPFYNVVGLHPKNAIVKSLPMAACGSCLEIECADAKKCHKHPPLQVVITDQCDWDCNATNVNMHVLSFEQLAPTRYGRVNIRYRLVPCKPADPITIHIKDYRHTEGGWIRLAFKNVAGNAAINSVEIAKNGSDFHASGQADDPASPWLPMLNTFGAMWEKSELPEPPMDVRITNMDGQIVVIQKAVAVAGITGDVETTAQFPSLESVDGSSAGSSRSSSNATVDNAGNGAEGDVTAAPNQPNATNQSNATNAAAAATAGSHAGAKAAATAAAAASGSVAPNHPLTPDPSPQPSTNELPGAAAATPAANALPALNASTPNATNATAAAPLDSNNVTVGVALPQPPQKEQAARKEVLDLAAIAAKLNALASKGSLNVTNHIVDPFDERGNRGNRSSSNASVPLAAVAADSVESSTNHSELGDGVKPVTSAGPPPAAITGAAATTNSRPLSVGGRRMFV